MTSKLDSPLVGACHLAGQNGEPVLCLPPGTSFTNTSPIAGLFLSGTRDHASEHSDETRTSVTNHHSYPLDVSKNHSGRLLLMQGMTANQTHHDDDRLAGLQQSEQSATLGSADRALYERTFSKAYGSSYGSTANFDELCEFEWKEEGSMMSTVDETQNGNQQGSLANDLDRHRKSPTGQQVDDTGRGSDSFLWSMTVLEPRSIEEMTIYPDLNAHLQHRYPQP
jgi:hypothetical protein